LFTSLHDDIAKRWTNLLTFDRKHAGWVSKLG
jgi:hypothetical protein